MINNQIPPKERRRKGERILRTRSRRDSASKRQRSRSRRRRPRRRRKGDEAARTSSRESSTDRRRSADEQHGTDAESEGGGAKKSERPTGRSGHKEAETAGAGGDREGPRRRSAEIGARFPDSTDGEEEEAKGRREESQKLGSLHKKKILLDVL